jgi:hypothetical protein
MLPTVGDQLRETRRILADVIAPEVSGDYAVAALDDVLATLQMLEGAWDKVLPFLHWDNDQTARLLHQSAAGGALADRIATALAVSPPDPVDFVAVHGRNLELRALLAEVVRQAGPDTPGVTDHLRERIARYPMTATSGLPKRG